MLLKESSPISNSSNHNIETDREPQGMRSRSSTVGSESEKEWKLAVKEHVRYGASPDRSVGAVSEKGPKSPMMDM